MSHRTPAGDQPDTTNAHTVRDRYMLAALLIASGGAVWLLAPKSGLLTAMLLGAGAMHLAWGIVRTALDRA
jgi:hypothetical protein